jgi:branched-chain amino acid transport system permease protein
MGSSRPGGDDMTWDLLINAIVAGLMLGGFYAAVTVGISISFGMLDVVNIAHPAFIILGSYIAYIVNTTFGIDPILIALLALPAFYALGAAVYQVYYVSFERRGQEALRGLAFFFGLLFITEVVLILVFGVDYRYVQAAYIGPTWRLGFVDFPLRMLVPCVVSILLVVALQLLLSRTFIGRVFAICVLGGMGSLPGTVIAAMLLGVVESFTATFYGPSWAPAVSFGFLLATLAVRPAGILGR